MRQIKFRGWDTDTKTMRKDVTGFEGVTGLMDGIFVDGDFRSIVRGEMIPLQFTGMLDKNGAEIFEGDIVKLKGENGEVWVVYWFYDGWCLGDGKEGVGGFQEDYDNGDYYNGDTIDWDKTEIIGNIYEKPELLTK